MHTVKLNFDASNKPHCDQLSIDLHVNFMRTTLLLIIFLVQNIYFWKASEVILEVEVS